MVNISLCLFIDNDVTKARTDFANSYGIIMDCSESSYGQLYDHFQDIKIVQQVVTNLKVIYITHQHGDHHMGLMKILFERDQALQSLYTAEEINANPTDFEIFVCIPFFMADFILLSCRTFAYKDLVKIIPTNKLNPEPEKHFYNVDQVLDSCTEEKKINCPEKSVEE
jgi:ribonuclease BN (tRNA processing enzyme)